MLSRTSTTYIIISYSTIKTFWLGRLTTGGPRIQLRAAPFHPGQPALEHGIIVSYGC